MILKLILTWYESIFPEREDFKIVKHLQAEELFTLIQPELHDDIVTLMSFKDKTTRALIHEAKFQANHIAFNWLHQVVLHYLKHIEGDYILIPIPLSKQRQKERTYNQVYEIIKNIPTTLPHMKIDKTSIVRLKHTKPQTTLNRSDRLTNVKNAFVVKNPTAITGKNIIVIDDVTTTGATLQAVRNVVNLYDPASIILLAITH